MEGEDGSAINLLTPLSGSLPRTRPGPAHFTFRDSFDFANPGRQVLGFSHFAGEEVKTQRLLVLSPSHAADTQSQNENPGAVALASIIGPSCPAALHSPPR